jgi:hypothetical protein
MAAKRTVVTVDDLDNALKSRDFARQWSTFECYNKQRPSLDALPVLRKALRNKNHAIVRSAAETLEKLGPAALPAMPDLFQAANRTDGRGRPQCYPDCLKAMVSIDPDNEGILELITHWVGFHNWGIISNAMAALQLIGSVEAYSLLQRIHGFWFSHLSKAEKKIADRFLVETQKKAKLK